VNVLLAMPPAVRLVVLALVGVIAGSIINAGIYALAWFSRPISPWQRKHPNAPPRRLADFLPIIGWFGLARESKLHGRGFWIRPILIELACAIGLPLLYQYEMASRLAPPIPLVLPPTLQMLHHEFFSHAILFGLMLVATFIDFDEKTIPDEITISGVLVALFLAALWPDSHLPVVRPVVLAMPGLAYMPLLFTSSSEWPSWLNDWRGLVLGMALFIGWCIALIPALLTLRRGIVRAVRYYVASVARESSWWKLLTLAAIGSLLIALVWRQDGAPWQGLLSSLVGMGFGGGLVWAVRIAGRIALRKEAMGFGDVTLMAMIGAFVGWQPSLMIFFLSPFAALVIALAQVVLTGRRDIPYGPYLCAATVVVILFWPRLWQNFQGAFDVGWLLPAVLAVCLVLLAALLTAWRILERAIFR
jgi:leader peptidase (prepilin peptidase) / N-methyltransferase